MASHPLGPYVLDSRTLTLHQGSEIVRLPMKSAAVLLALVERRGRIVTKDELLEIVWPDSIVEEANLTVHVALLRRTLGDAAVIETVPKRGYRLLEEARAEGTAPAASTRVREAVLRGRYLWNKFTRDSLERACAVFEDARRDNPESGDAESGLSDALLLQGLLGFRQDRAVFTTARFHAERSVRLSPQSADAWASWAFACLFDSFAFSVAEEALSRARELAPTRVEPHLWSAFYHALRGNGLRALEAARAATSIDPISLKAFVGSGFHLYLTQQYEPDIAPLERALELEPDFAMAHWGMGLALDRLGNFERAIEAHRKAVRHSGGSPTLDANLARSLALGGRHEEARDSLARLIANGLAPYRVATVEAALGENARAIASIERAYAIRDPWLVVLKVDPMLEAIQADSRIQLIEKAVQSA